jgi:metal-responsive CopG/Arc/MetJ family transcriptional regulator
MPTYTSTLPEELLLEVSKLSKELKVPKNKLIEKALTIFITEYKRAQYAASFRRASADTNLTSIAEEGMSEYLKTVNAWDETR